MKPRKTFPPEGGAERRVMIGRGRTAVWLVLTSQGHDLVLRIGGGEAHVGAVATVSSRGGIGGESCDAMTVVPGHKEGPLAAEGARRLAATAGCTCVCIVGIHLDAITPEEIAAVTANVERGVEELVRVLEELQG